MLPPSTMGVAKAKAAPLRGRVMGVLPSPRRCTALTGFVVVNATSTSKVRFNSLLHRGWYEYTLTVTQAVDTSTKCLPTWRLSSHAASTISRSGIATSTEFQVSVLVSLTAMPKKTGEKTRHLQRLLHRTPTVCSFSLSLF